MPAEPDGPLPGPPEESAPGAREQQIRGVVWILLALLLLVAWRWLRLGS
jgi:hypothetical protein